MTNKNFYLSTDFNQRKNEFVTYCSEGYKITEDEILKLLKILLKEKRNLTLGKKILFVYIDSTSDRISQTENNLKKICVHYERTTKTFNGESRKK